MKERVKGFKESRDYRVSTKGRKSEGNLKNFKRVFRPKESNIFTERVFKYKEEAWPLLSLLLFSVHFFFFGFLPFSLKEEEREEERRRLKFFLNSFVQLLLCLN